MDSTFIIEETQEDLKSRLPGLKNISPIEFQFAILKRYIQKHFRAAWDISPDLVLDVAMRDLHPSTIGIFHHFGYSVESLEFVINNED